MPEPPPVIRTMSPEINVFRNRHIDLAIPEFLQGSYNFFFSILLHLTIKQLNKSQEFEKEKYKRDF